MNEPAVRLHAFIEAVAEGDRAALAHLFGATSDRLYGVVLRILRKPDLAAQALVDAYLRIWREAPTYVPSLMDPLSWMIMLARRSAHDLTQDRPPLGHDQMVGGHEQATEAEEEESRRAVSEELKRVLACLATLSPDSRHMTLLAYYDGWGHDELAVLFDASPATIRTWMLRALDQIRQCLGR